MSLQFPEIPEKLTAAEQRIVEFIESHREELLFMTISQLAAQLEMSEATVSRFVRHVGCQDFKHLKTVIMEQCTPEGPAGKLAGTLLGDGAFTPERYLVQQQVCLQKTIAHLDQDAFAQALREIRSARRIFIHAKSASASLGQLLLFRLRRLGLPVSLLPSGGSELMEGLSQAEAGDLVIMFSFSKISWEGRIILDYQEEAAYRTLAFTSRLHAPVEDQADVNLYVYRGQEWEYHSMTAATAVIDALMVALSEQLGADAAKRLKRIHDMKKHYSAPGKR